jgi:hypothetical protein
MTLTTFGLPLLPEQRKSITIYSAINNDEDLRRCSRNIAAINSRLSSVADQSSFVARGTLVYTLPKAIRYRNDATYLWDGEKLVPLISTNLDDYGMTPPELTVQPGEPINLFMAPTHNNYWWPSPELRQAVLDAPVHSIPVTGLGMHVEYRDIESNGKTFRFMSDETSNLQTGTFSYPPEWFNSDETVYVGNYQSSGDDSTLHITLPENVVLCSIDAALTPDYEVCYDDWDE